LANNQAAPILSLDAPSGVDLTTGKIYDATIRATSTMTLALPKIGLADKKVQAYRGELFLADISVPVQLYHEPTLNMEVPFIFRDRDIVKLG
jgi:NAD(P)H-hydrate epimerase